MLAEGSAERVFGICQGCERAAELDDDRNVGHNKDVSDPSQASNDAPSVASASAAASFASW